MFYIFDESMKEVKKNNKEKMKKKTRNEHDKTS